MNSTSDSHRPAGGRGLPGHDDRGLHEVDRPDPGAAAGYRQAPDPAMLSWCIGEIAESLAQCEQQLDACVQEPLQGVQALAAARAALHQVHGALAIVQVRGVPVLIRAAEDVLAALRQAPDEALRGAFARAFAAVLEYLDGFLHGSAEQPLYLFPWYEALQRAAGNDYFHPADLYLIPRQPMFASSGVVRNAAAHDTGDTDDELLAARKAFEQGLLVVLRERSGQPGVAALHASVVRIGSSRVGQADPAFWKVALAWFEALRDEALLLDVYGKRLLARLNLHLRAAIAGDADAPESLLRELLFSLASLSDAGGTDSALVAEVREAFALAGSVPVDFAIPRFAAIDARTLQAAQAEVGRLAASWERLACGERAAHADFVRAIDALRPPVSMLALPGVHALIDACARRGRCCAQSDDAPPEALAIGFASSLMFLEQIFASTPAARAENDHRAAALARWLAPDDLDDSARHSDLAGPMPSWLQELVQSSQQRSAMSGLVAGVREDLDWVEQTLDGFFRDPAQRQDLSAAAQRLRAIAGVLELPGHAPAAAAARHVAQQVDGFAAGSDAAPAEACRGVADNIGALGFFIDGLLQPGAHAVRYAFDHEQGRFQAMFGVADDRQPAAGPTLWSIPLDETESPLIRHVRQAMELADACVQRPDDGNLRQSLRRALGRVRDDAHFAGDAESMRLADEALTGLIDPHGEKPADVLADLRQRVARLLTDVSPEASEGKTQEGEAQEGEVREEDASGAGESAGCDPCADSDAELVGIFLDEARETLAGIAEANARRWADPDAAAGGDQDSSASPVCGDVPEKSAIESLTCIRRGFHTLKGSSRMVGLASIGDAAWAMEELLNRRLAGEMIVGKAGGEEAGAGEGAEGITGAAGTLVADEALAGLVDTVSAAFRQWVEVLQADASAAIDAQPVFAAIGLFTTAGSEQRALPVDEAVEGREDLPMADGAEVADAEVAEADVADDGVDKVVEEAGFVEAIEAIDGCEVAGRAADDGEAVVRIGERSIERRLYEIFLTEADELLAALASDLQEWRGEPQLTVRAEAQRAMHSLRGSAALVQLDEVHAIAESLERYLLRLPLRTDPVQSSELADYEWVLDRLRALLHQFAAGTVPRAEPQALALARELADGATVPQGRDAEELDLDLLPVFIEEAVDQLPRIGAHLRDWQTRPQDRGLVQSLMRDLHTVKGGARMAGAMALGQRLHEMETRLETAAALSKVPEVLVDELIAEYDLAAEMFEALRDRRHPLPMAPSLPLAASGVDSARVTSVEADSQRVADAPKSAGSPLSAAAPPSREPVPAREGPSPVVRAAVSSPLVRVRADLLEHSVNESGEISIARARIDNELGGLRQSLQDLTENVARLRAQLREIEIQSESRIQARFTRRGSADAFAAGDSGAAGDATPEAGFDPLEFDRYTRFQELTRMLAESVDDVATVQANAMRGLDAVAQDTDRQSRLLRDLQQNLMRMRMVRFGTISDRLYRVVRQAAKELGKRVALDVRGAATEVDRGVLERMAGPIEHLLRNAITHGIEMPDVRQASGKAAVGEVQIDVRQEGNEVMLVVRDDGRGLDYERIAGCARQRGLLAADAQTTQHELAELIFQPGFSTAADVSELSGRGVGADVVRAEVHSLGGRIGIDSRAGAGTTFTVHLPLTLSIAQVVIVTLGEMRYALPSSGIEQVLQLTAEQLARAYGDGSIEWRGAGVPLHHLGMLVGLGDCRPRAQHLSPVVVVRSGGLRLAVHVDSVSGNREVVVKSVGAQAARVPGIAGATVLGDGEIVLLMNVARVAQQILGDLWLGRPGGSGPELAPVPPTVMIVDDSLTVRKVTQRLLVREGYDVMLARDGVDAMRQLQDRRPDVMLVDIEMPRMDGFDLTRNVRADERLREVPIVMITSRTADKHRSHAQALGVNVFLGKPYRDDELLGHIAAFVSGRARRAWLS